MTELSSIAMLQQRTGGTIDAENKNRSLPGPAVHLDSKLSRRVQRNFAVLVLPFEIWVMNVSFLVIPALHNTPEVEC